MCRKKFIEEFINEFKLVDYDIEDTMNKLGEYLDFEYSILDEYQSNNCETEFGKVVEIRKIGLDPIILGIMCYGDYDDIKEMFPKETVTYFTKDGYELMHLEYSEQDKEE